MNRRWVGSAILALVICVAACGGASPGGGSQAPRSSSEAADPSPSATPAATRTPDPTPVVTPKPTNQPEPAEEPVTPAPEPSGELVAVLMVRCGDGAPDLNSDRVRATRDGVRLRITGQKGWTLGMGYETGGDGIDLKKGTQEVVRRLPPGDLTLNCGDSRQAEPLPDRLVRIEDPDGWYRSMAIGDVAGSCVSGDAMYVEGARGSKANPVAQARKQLRKGLRPGDVVQRGGYPADKGLVRVVRDGQVIGTLTYEDDGHGGWLFRRLRAVRRAQRGLILGSADPAPSASPPGGWPILRVPPHHEGTR